MASADGSNRSASQEGVVDAPSRPVPILRELYFGYTPRARRFRFSVLCFDVVTIAYFLVTTVGGSAEQFQTVDVVIGVVLAVDLAARTLAMRRPLSQLWTIAFYIDLLVLIALFGSALVPDLDYARILRLLRVLRSYRLLIELRKDSKWFRRNEDVLESALNLTVFITITTSLVYLIEVDSNAEIQHFVDALYFTITALTTTGFGDVTATGTSGRLLAIAIMVLGVGLFLRLIQALFRPAKVAFECSTCGLERHDTDAVHCKHCGEVIHIPTEGAV